MSTTAALSLLLLSCQLVQLLATANCPSSSAACHALSDEAGGALGLLQFFSGQSSSYQGGAGVGTGARNDIGAGRVASEINDSGADEVTALSKFVALRGLDFTAEALPEMNCTEHQTLCKAPFNCHSNPPTLQEQLAWKTAHMATADGHSNLRSWCSATKQENGIAKLCLQSHDLKGSAQVTYDLQVGRGIGELDGSYCFLEGHCTDAHVTYDTTVEEAEALCDAKYGHENWTSVSGLDIMTTSILHPDATNSSTGFHTRAVSSLFGMLACAMGNYHCDVVYCRDTYCKNPYYAERYGHYLKEYGWA